MNKRSKTTNTRGLSMNGEAADMTGSYVDQNDLAKLLRSPTKATAKQCLCAQIEYWFQVGT